MKTITYYAFARNQDGEIEQILVTKEQIKSHKWTGKIYKSVKDAEKDMLDLNCNGRFV